MNATKIARRLDSLVGNWGDEGYQGTEIQPAGTHYVLDTTATWERWIPSTTDQVQAKWRDEGHTGSDNHRDRMLAMICPLLNVDPCDVTLTNTGDGWVCRVALQTSGACEEGCWTDGTYTDGPY